MSKGVYLSVCAGVLCALAALSASAMDRGPAPRGEHAEPAYHEYLDPRYNHNHAYPSRGQIVRTLPPERIAVFDHGQHPYYQYRGVWYAPRRVGYAVVGPPIGVTVAVLPPFYTTVWFGGIPYYYANGTYYHWHENERSYEVVEPPNDSASTTAPAPQAEEVFVYPKNGQSSQQQSRDRYDCHRWAVTETHFDPTQSGGNVPEEQHANKSADYHRAETACLEGRGYSVK